MVCKDADQIAVIGSRLGWEVCPGDRICLFAPLEDSEIAEALNLIFDDWDLEAGEPGEGYTVWTGAWQIQTPC